MANTIDTPPVNAVVSAKAEAVRVGAYKTSDMFDFIGVVYSGAIGTYLNKNVKTPNGQFAFLIKLLNPVGRANSVGGLITEAWVYEGQVTWLGRLDTLTTNTPGTTNGTDTVIVKTPDSTTDTGSTTNTNLPATDNTNTYLIIVLIAVITFKYILPRFQK